MALTVCAASTVALTIALRRVSTPSLDLTPLRNGASCSCSWCSFSPFSESLLLHDDGPAVHLRSAPVEVALVMTPAQLAAVAGAAPVSRMLRRWGITRSGTLMMVLVAATLFASALLHIHGTLWLAVVIMCVYSAAASRVRGGGDERDREHRCATNKGRRRVGLPRGRRQSGCSDRGCRDDRHRDGRRVAVAAARINRAGISPATAREVVASSVRGATPQETSSQYAVPLSDVSEIDELRRRADLGGFRAQESWAAW